METTIMDPLAQLGANGVLVAVIVSLIEVIKVQYAKHNCKKNNAKYQTVDLCEEKHKGADQRLAALSKKVDSDRRKHDSFVQQNSEWQREVIGHMAGLTERLKVATEAIEKIAK